MRLRGLGGTSHLAAKPSACEHSYCAVRDTGLDGGSGLVLAAIARWIRQKRIIASQGSASVLATAIGRDLEGKISPVLYAIAADAVAR
jgi:hypothetical protein